MSYFNAISRSWTACTAAPREPTPRPDTLAFDVDFLAADDLLAVLDDLLTVLVDDFTVVLGVAPAAGLVVAGVCDLAGKVGPTAPATPDGTRPDRTIPDTAATAAAADTPGRRHEVGREVGANMLSPCGAAGVGEGVGSGGQRWAAVGSGGAEVRIGPKPKRPQVSLNNVAN